MPSRPCLSCHALVPIGRSCRRCGPRRRTPGRGSGWEASAFRAAVLVKAGHRCEFVNAQGVRCTATSKLEAHHVVDLRDGGSNDPATNGMALCRRHHRIVARG